jgi:hypothetical protein
MMQGHKVGLQRAGGLRDRQRVFDDAETGQNHYLIVLIGHTKGDMMEAPMTTPKKMKSF